MIANVKTIRIKSNDKDKSEILNNKKIKSGAWLSVFTY